jgi:hypothetical protein
MPLQSELVSLREKVGNALKKLRPKNGNISQHHRSSLMPHRSQAIELFKICRQLVPENQDYAVKSD